MRIENTIWTLITLALPTHVHRSRLIAERDASETLPVSEDVPVASEDNNLYLFVGEFVLEFEDEFDIVDTRGVHRTGGLGLFGEECEREAVGEGLWDQGVVLVGFDQTEIAALLGTETRQVVQTQVHVLDWVAAPLARIVKPVVDVHLALTLHGPHQFDDGVVEVQVHAHLRLIRHDVEVLHLVDQLFERAGCESVTLVNIEIHVGGQQTRIEVILIQGLAGIALEDEGIAIRNLHTVDQVGKDNVNLDAVKLQRHQRQRVTRGLGEPEGQRHIEASILLRVCNQLSASETLTNHFSQTLARLASKFLPHVQEISVQDTDHLTTDNQTGTLNQKLANRVGPVSPGARQTGAGIELIRRSVGRIVVHLSRRRSLAAIVTVALRDAVVTRVAVVRRARKLGRSNSTDTLRIFDGLDGRQVNHRIHKVNQITGTIQGDLTIRTESNLRVKRLFNCFHRVVRVLIVSKSEKSDGRIGGQVLIGRTQRNQFSQRTTSGGT